jgi:hypothetical protein
VLRVTDSAQDQHLDPSDVADVVLTAVRDKYLDSADFNGLHLTADIGQPVLAAAADLVLAGRLQVVSGEDFLNIHVRPWASRRSLEEQAGSLVNLSDGDYGVALYPTALGMQDVELPERFSGRPYDQAVARGRGVLETAFFDLAVLEPYRNDPRYRFSHDDFGADMFVSDNVYEDQTEPERDKVSLAHIGFAYDTSKYDPTNPESLLVRRAVAFYGDLARLTAEHQQRWWSYRVDDDGLSPHPVWYDMQMGRWPDGSGPFTRLHAEMENINHLWTTAFGAPLFRTTDKPRELGWLLRPAQRDWDEFVHQLDKLLADNLDAKALDAAGAPTTNAAGDKVGTLGRLVEFMIKHKVDPDAARSVMKPLRDVRTARQQPAHKIAPNTRDRTLVHKQVDLLWQVNSSLMDIQNWLSTHPKNRGLEIPYEDKRLGKPYRM